MQITPLGMFLALLAIAVVGCSPHTDQQTSQQAPVVEAPSPPAAVSEAAPELFSAPLVDAPIEVHAAPALAQPAPMVTEQADEDKSSASLPPEPPPLLSDFSASASRPPAEEPTSPLAGGNPLRDGGLSETDHPMRQNPGSLPRQPESPAALTPVEPPEPLTSIETAPAETSDPLTAVRSLPAAPPVATPSEVTEPARPLVSLTSPASDAFVTPTADSPAPSDIAASRMRAKRSGVPYDPVRENGPIFVNWPKPKLALVITGRTDGYFEPCGCAGLDRMKGGLSRRHGMIDMLRQEKGWPVVAVDVGGLTKGYGPQTEIKFRFTVDALRMMNYDAITFGRNDLRLPAGELVSVAAPPSAFVSANVGLFGFDAKMNEAVRIIEAGGIKVGVTAVLGEQYQAEIQNQEIEMAAPEARLAAVVPGLRKQCNLLVLLAHATKDESIALAQQFPDFGLVVTSGGPAEPPAEAQQIENTRSLLIEVGEKGMNAVVLGFYDDPKQPVRYQRVPLDSRFPSSVEMKRLMEAYQEQLKMLGLEGLSVRPAAHPQQPTHGDYVGSEKCATCHEKSYDIWKKTGHAKAFQTLVETDPPRVHDPECISCHVVGWHPTNYFPYKSGYLDAEQTPHLKDVGCESCHGPGGAHVAAESGGDMALQEELQKAMVVTKEEAQTNHAKWCQNCHDLDNSPDFNFDTYWPDVEHYEDD